MFSTACIFRQPYICFACIFKWYIPLPRYISLVNGFMYHEQTMAFMTNKDHSTFLHICNAIHDEKRYKYHEVDHHSHTSIYLCSLM